MHTCTCMYISVLASLCMDNSYYSPIFEIGNVMTVNSKLAALNYQKFIVLFSKELDS